MKLPKGLITVGMIALSFCLIYGIFLSVLNSDSIYENVQPAEQNEAILAFLDGEDIVLDFLDEKEQGHMQDVYKLFQLAKKAFLVSVTFLLIITGLFVAFKQWKTLEDFYGRILQVSGSTLLFLGAFAGIATFLDFKAFWVVFHVILFPQGNWIFPTTSTLISLYPSEFFQHFLFVFGIRLAIASVVIVILGTWMLRMMEQKGHFSKVQKEKPTNDKE